MEIVDVSRLQRALHIDNCRKRPRSAWNVVWLCGFFVVFLKEKRWARMTPLLLNFSAAWMSLMELLHFQLFGGRRLKAPSAPRAQTTVGNTTNARGTPAMTSAEPLTPGSPTKPSHVQEEHPALLGPYLPSLRQTAAEDRKGISTCQTPSSEHPAGIQFPENKHIFIILAWLQRKTQTNCSATNQSEGVVDQAAIISALMFTVAVSVLYLDFFHSLF